MQNCGLDDISYLQGLTNLTSIVLTNNYIDDISALSGLTSLKTLKLRGNYIDDYTPISGYYSNLTTKDFSLTDKDDAVFFVPNLSNSTIGTAILRLKSTRPTNLYYSLEMYDKNTDELLTRKRNYTSPALSYSSASVSIPEKIQDNANTYVVLSIYENYTYRHLMSKTIIDGTCFDLSNFN